MLYPRYPLTSVEIERRIAPFWRGLNDYSEAWTEHQLVAAARGLPVPAPDEVPTEDHSTVFPSTGPTAQIPDKGPDTLGTPIASRSQSYQSDTSSINSPDQSTFVMPSVHTPSSPQSSGFRSRAKTLASLTSSSKNPQIELTPREMQLPKDPYVSGQRLEAYLYKDATECPICFLYYPPYLNRTRCCDQPICSECFVQIKRPDPHPPEHTDPSAPPPPSIESAEPIDPESLVSEPAACPFCVQPEFGITYEPPPFRRGLTYVNHAHTHPLTGKASAMSSSSSLVSAKSGGQASPTDPPRRRTQSLSATAPTVITTDRIRPGWHQKLASARAHAARRSAAATALHTAAYLMGNRGHEPDGRGFGAFGRRALLRRGSGGDAGASQLNMLAMMSERYGRVEGGEDASHRTRRVRAEDLDEMMMMEAIRLSIASEEERRKKEEKEARKDAKKDAKKQEKENRKAEKAAKKGRVHIGSASQSTTDLVSPRNRSTWDDNSSSAASKGKGIQRPDDPREEPSNNFSFPTSAYPDMSEATEDSAQQHLEYARAQIQPEGYGSSPYRPSHLRNLSSVSSTDDESAANSLRTGFHTSDSFDGSSAPTGVDRSTAGTSQVDYTPGTPGGGAGLEPMFNFRSLAAMVGDHEKHESSKFTDFGEGTQRGTVVNEPAAAGSEASAANISLGASTKIANESFHDASEIPYPAVPEVNITTPSRTNSGTLHTSSEKQAQVSEGETMVGSSQRIVS